MGLVAAVGVAVVVVVFFRPGARVDALELRQYPLVRTLQFSARVATLSRVDVGSTLTGRVAQVMVREGVQVRKGELLIRLETEELNAALTQAAAAERQADATLHAAKASLVRGQQLVTQGFYSGSQLDEAQRAVDVAQAQLASARASVTAARARLVQTAVLAPADARVLSRQVEPGQIVQPGKALMSLALSGPTQLNAQVDERFLDQLQTGQKATVVADAFAAQRFAARVLSISPVVDPQRGAIEVKFSLEQQPPAYLREDMTLSVEVETARRERALVLPLAALHTAAADSVASVLVVREGRAQERTVRLGLRTLDAVEVLQGLAEGDLVLLANARKAGDRVRANVIGWQPGLSAARGAQREDAGPALTNAMGR
ncbi:MAG: efflux RND transporter periplasmic adaptor subunit [Microbacteriaceae bacterium]|nr:efflux RND transporter periplasmic adaptor subunit [Burkholderiaceae bacterium]